MGDFVRAVGVWWFGAVPLLVGSAWAVFSDSGGLITGLLAATGMLIVLVGAYRAYDRTAQELDQRRSRPEPDNARFTIKAAVPYTGVPSGVNTLILPDAHVVNRSDTPIELRFTLLAADGSGPLEAVIPSSRTISAGAEVLPNPMRLDPHSGRNGRLIWRHGGGDVTQYVAAGVVLRVLDEQSGQLVDITQSTAGFEYPSRKPS